MSIETPLLPTYISEGRFAVVDENHSAGSLWILTILCLVYSTLVLVLRGHLRWGLYAIDDYLAVIATIFQTGEVIALMFAMSNGIGTNYQLLSAESLVAANRATYAGIVLFILSMSFAKCSVVMLMMKLFNLRGHRSGNDRTTKTNKLLCYAALGLIAIWGIGSIVGLTAGCNSRNFTETATESNSCPAQTVRWDVVTALDVVTECLLVILSIIIVAPVRLSISMKVPVVIAFGFRLICAVLSILHNHYIHDYVYDNANGLQIIPVLNLMQVELCWSMISAMIPNLKAFIRSFNSGFGLGFELDGMTNNYGSSKGTGRRAVDYELSQMKSSHSPGPDFLDENHVQTDLIETQPKSRNYANQSANDIHYRAGTRSIHEVEGGSLTSTGSQDQIIRKDVQWQVSYEEAHAR